MKRQTFDENAGLAAIADARIAQRDPLAGQIEVAGSEPRSRTAGSAQTSYRDAEPSRVRQIAQALLAMARELDRGEEPAPARPARGSRAAIVAGSLHRDRLQRARYFPPGLFGEPAWDILLDLFAALHGCELRSVKEVCLAANVPEATALRHIEGLIAQGLVTCRRDRTDNRRKFLTMTPEGNRRVLDYLRSTHPHLDRRESPGL